jgi:hypothetical protein
VSHDQFRFKEYVKNTYAPLRLPEIRARLDALRQEGVEGTVLEALKELYAEKLVSIPAPQEATKPTAAFEDVALPLRRIADALEVLTGKYYHPAPPANWYHPPPSADYQDYH